MVTVSSVLMDWFEVTFRLGGNTHTHTHTYYQNVVVSAHFLPQEVFLAV